LEISDAGIVAAVGTPAQLIEIERNSNSSPGFALPQKDRLLLGKEAESKAQLYPRQILNRFWDQMDTEPLELSGKYTPQNHAEIVYHHLSHIWQVIQTHGDEIALVVPRYYNRQQLGLILGIAQELAMEVKGFIPMALAASSEAFPGKLLMYLDVHLHRIEIICLNQGEYLSVEDSATISEKGLIELYRQWVETIAQEFVRSTRFDPFHQAATEQELYDRLPGILSHLQRHSSLVFDMVDAATSYSVTLKHYLFARKAESIYGEVCRLVEKMRSKIARDKPAVVLQISHRLNRLPGCREMLSTIKNSQIIELDRGAAAIGALSIWPQLSDRRNTEGISFFTSRPWQHSRRKPEIRPSAPKIADTLPTHLLYGSIAYPITDRPLTIGREADTEKTRVRIYGHSQQISPRYCTIELRGGKVVLYDYSTDGIFVDETRVNGHMVLKLGQIIRLGASGGQLQLIACLNRNET
jgi:pSer/pThr/pTyr-binding forkhead associated (FHA) protein